MTRNTSTPRSRRSTIILFSALLLLIPGLLSGADFPKPVGYVNDFAGVIGSSDEDRIERVALAVDRATGADIVVVTVESLGEYGSIEQYSIAMATEWGIETGVLLIISMSERQARIEVSDVLEGPLPDGMVGRIMDTSVIPYFRKNDFGTGFLKAAEGIAGIIAEEYDVTLPNVSLAESRKYTQSSSRSRTTSFPFRYIIFIIIMFAGGGRFMWPMIFLGGMGRSRYSRGGFGSSSRGGFGGGGGFGGFGGGGGGGFSGGGASRGF